MEESVTVEKRTLISPADILALEFECPHCHARHTVQVAKLDRLLYRCPNCNEDLIQHGPGDREPDDAVIHAFVRALGEMQRRKFGANLRLEITNTDLQEKA
jgi:transposase-like protein